MFYSTDPREYWQKESLSTMYLLIKEACFCKKVYNIFNMKRSWSKLVSTRRSTVLNLLLKRDFLAYFVSPSLTNKKKFYNIETRSERLLHSRQLSKLIFAQVRLLDDQVLAWVGRIGLMRAFFGRWGWSRVAIFWLRLAARNGLDPRPRLARIPGV